MEQYIVTGMSCAACQARVEKAVSKVPGVTSVSVSLLTNSMGVEGNASEAEIISAVEAAGYGAGKKTAERSSASEMNFHAEEEALRDRETPVLKKRLLFSAVFLLILMYISMGHNMWGWPLPPFLHGNYTGLALTQLLLSATVMIINGKFYISGFRALFHGAPNMDTLVALGSSVSFGWSVFIFYMITYVLSSGSDPAGLYHDQLYFEAAAMIPALITVGKLLEALSKGRTTNALKSLLRIAPKQAVLLKNGEEINVPVEEVQIGDIFILRPGYNVPVDGVVISGNSAVDEAALTGESIPVDKAEGDSVSAATINGSGYLQCRAVRVGQDTTFAGIIRLVSDAAATKAPIAKIADRVSGIFVPVVMIIAMLVVVGWLIAGTDVGSALERGIAVLVISCPCALGLATPVAIMVANGVGAKNGILFKTGEALETAGRAEIIALDKTGTITTGEPKVTGLYPASGFTEEELLAFAAALENRSEHPLAKAILAEAEEKKCRIPEITDFSAHPGKGLEGLADGRKLYGGKEEYISTVTEVNREALDRARELAEQGKTPLFFAEEGHFLGIIAVADTVKPDSAEAIRQLKKLGLRVVMLTGDNEQTARQIGREAGVDEVIANVLPEGKQEAILSLRGKNICPAPGLKNAGEAAQTKEIMKAGASAQTKKNMKAGTSAQTKVIMVGDGINDAPALKAADLGIAIGAGTDVAIDSADVVLMHSTLTDAAAAIRLSRGTIRNIHENLFWAFFYNLICIPLAAGLFGWQMSPMIGAAAMSLSSFTVCMNALRLNRLRPRDASHDRPLRKHDEKMSEAADKTDNEFEEGKDEQKQDKGLQTERRITAEMQEKEVAEADGIKSTGEKITIKEKTEKDIIGKGAEKMQATVKIEGMMCGHCEANVKKAMEALPFVESAEVSHEKGTAVLSLCGELDAKAVQDAVEAKDYTFVGISS